MYCCAKDESSLVQRVASIKACSAVVLRQQTSSLLSAYAVSCTDPEPAPEAPQSFNALAFSQCCEERASGCLAPRTSFLVIDISALSLHGKTRLFMRVVVFQYSCPSTLSCPVSISCTALFFTYDNLPGFSYVEASLPMLVSVDRWSSSSTPCLVSITCTSVFSTASSRINSGPFSGPAVHQQHQHFYGPQLHDMTRWEVVFHGFCAGDFSEAHEKVVCHRFLRDSSSEVGDSSV